MQDPLIRKTLPAGWIDLAVGEAKVVRQALFGCHPRDLFEFKEDVGVWEYQHPSGYQPLVHLLQNRFGKPVVVTCGAKQGLSAVFYALRKRGKVSVGIEVPYWSQMPPAIRLSGLNVVLGDAASPTFDSYLHVAPNNPDGCLRSLEESKKLYETYKERNIPFIHDAAYYHEIYAPGQHLGAFGDVRIFSVSKLYGMSGMRLGYVVCDDESFYDDIMEYVETTTVGVSAPAQRIFYEILTREQANPDIYRKFVSTATEALLRAKLLASQIHPEILDTTGVVNTNGMFGWFKKGPLFRPDAAKVHVIDGLTFGDPTKVRLNLAVDWITLQQAVTALHNAAGV